MRMRRGCLPGCGGLLLLCVLAGLLSWLVVIPRVMNVFEKSVAEGVSTAIVEQISSTYSRSELQQGREIAFSFDQINQALRQNNENGRIDRVAFTTVGDRLEIQASINGEHFQFAFEPTVTSDGHLELKPVGEGGWWRKQIMSILGGGVESAINIWLDENNLQLSDVMLDGDSLVLQVVGRP